MSGVEVLSRYRAAPMAHVHLDEVMAIEKLSYSNPWPRDSFVHEIDANAFSHPVVVTSLGEHGEIAGYCVFWVVFDQLDIQNIAVHPRHRRRGLARFLLRRALDEGRERSAQRARLELRASNHVAYRLYASMGFESAGTRADYYSRPREDALLLQKPLR